MKRKRDQTQKNTCGILDSFFLLVCPPEKFRASRRSCEIERAENANFATAGNTGKKKKQERKGPETAPWTVSITRLLWLRQWRTLFLAAIRSLCLLSSRGSSLSLASIRDGERNRTKGTSPIAPQRLPRLPRSPHHPGFLTPASFFFTHPPPCSSRQPSNLSTHKFTQPLHPDRNESVFKNASLFNFIISVALIFPDLIYILQLDWSVISM